MSFPQDKAAEDLPAREAGFVNPPDTTYPWFYSFWMEGNITKEGITADLEAMRQAGLAGDTGKLWIGSGTKIHPAAKLENVLAMWDEVEKHAYYDQVVGT